MVSRSSPPENGRYIAVRAAVVILLAGGVRISRCLRIEYTASQGDVMTDLSTFRFSHPVEVRFGDIDGMGHVNNAMYFTYMETARIRYIGEVLGWDGDMHGLGFILARISCDFKLPLAYGDSVRVYVRVTHFGKASFGMAYVLVRERDGAIVATGESVQVAYDYGAGASVTVPDEWRARITAFEPALEA
jgi:acyl-CoA thioester hydrolase